MAGGEERKGTEECRDRERGKGVRTEGGGRREKCTEEEWQPSDMSLGCTYITRYYMYTKCLTRLQNNFKISGVT